MKKIGKPYIRSTLDAMYLKHHLFLQALLFGFLVSILIPSMYKTVHAQDILVTASVPSGSVFAGERFTLNVDIRTNEPREISDPVLPDLQGMRYLSTVPNLSTSYTMVNRTARMTYRYSFTVEAIETGSYQIPPIYVQVDDQEYATRPITVVVNAMDGRTRRALSRRKNSPPVFLELELSENNPVRGQQVIAEIVLYFQNSIEVSTFQVTESWQTEGFWREDLNDRQTRQASSVIVNGNPYRRAVLARYAMFPTRSGELTIPPFTIRTTVRQSGQYRNQVDPFFDGFGRRRDINLQTNERALQISPLPAAPLDGQLISAMGQFTVERTLSRNQVVLGDAIDVITEIQGSGNLGLITRPEYEYPETFDTHRPRETIDRDPNVPRMAGTKQFRDVLIARNAGRFTLSESTVLIYNDITRDYEKHVLPELEIEVVRDPNTRISLAQNNEFRIIPARGSVRWQTAEQHRASLWSKWWFWFLILLPAIAIISSHRLYRYRQKLANDEQFARFENAYYHAKDQLLQSAGDPDPKMVYSRIRNALVTFITCRLGINNAGISDNHLLDALRKADTDPLVIQRVEKMIKKCATIRYSPDPPLKNAAMDLTEAHNLLTKLKAQL